MSPNAAFAIMAVDFSSTVDQRTNTEELQRCRQQLGSLKVQDTMAAKATQPNVGAHSFLRSVGEGIRTKGTVDVEVEATLKNAEDEAEHDNDRRFVGGTQTLPPS